jgi:hypothetical protein
MISTDIVPSNIEEEHKPVDGERAIIVSPSKFFVKYLKGVDSVMSLDLVEAILKDQRNRLGMIYDMI